MLTQPLMKSFLQKYKQFSCTGQIDHSNQQTLCGGCLNELLLQQWESICLDCKPILQRWPLGCVYETRFFIDCVGLECSLLDARSTVYCSPNDQTYAGTNNQASHKRLSLNCVSLMMISSNFSQSSIRCSIDIILIFIQLFN